ncbi:MAG: SSU ribosomal protein S11p (S14e), partial [uncultured Acidimicrobiales bacterium]
GQAEAGRASPPPQRAQERHLWRCAHQELVQQHDRGHHRHGGQRPVVGLGRKRRLQGLPQVDALRSPAGGREGRPRRHGARSPQGRRAGEGSRLRPRDRHPVAAEQRHRGRWHQRRHPHPAQRLPPQEAAPGL